jgi:hypothetical protein
MSQSCEGELYDLLIHMREHGSSVILNWGEDNDLWEASFISGGIRYTAFSISPLVAAREAHEKAILATRQLGFDV